jgi:hypothetical protein
MPIGKDETKEEFLKRLEQSHRLAEELFADELAALAADEAQKDQVDP